MVFYWKKLCSYKNIALCFVIILLVTCWKAQQLAIIDDVSFLDYWQRTFYGHGSGRFRLFEIIELITIHSAPLYVIAVFLENRRGDQDAVVIIRLSSKKVWLYSTVSIGIVWIILYVISFFVVGSLVGVVYGFSLLKFQLMAELLLLMSLDIVVQFLILFLVYTIKRNVTIAFFTVVATHLIAIWIIYFPTGISSVARSAEVGGLPFGLRVAILIGSLITIWLMIRKINLGKALLR
ncbi:hypothetical protein [Paenibacillus yanchengensis]|uniref:ABC transporter permease n=1 Tax=Paenibacillus yanchengensis TaxID=2035833 RepID=A0ABW4YF06_9BACL